MTEKKIGLNPLAIENIQRELQGNESPQSLIISTAADKIENLIFNDTLTGFENRRGLKRFRDNLKIDQFPLAIITFDLDNLKKINDNPDPDKGGHNRGDEYILSFVKFANDIFPDVKKFRLGGDEFAVPLLKVDQEKLGQLRQIYSKLRIFNEQNQSPNKLKFTFASTTTFSKEDFYKALNRSDLRLVKAKKIKKSRSN